MTLKDLLPYLNGATEDMELKVAVHCKNMLDYAIVEKEIADIRVEKSRNMIVLKTDILNLGPT